MFGNISGNKYNTYERGWSKFDQEKFVLEYFSVDWKDLLKIDELNADNSTKIYLDRIIMFLDTYEPLNKINKQKSKFKSKPWINLVWQKSISVKNKLLTNFINKKDPELKKEFQTNQGVSVKFLLGKETNSMVGYHLMAKGHSIQLGIWGCFKTPSKSSAGPAGG